MDLEWMRAFGDTDAEPGSPKAEPRAIAIGGQAYAVATDGFVLIAVLVGEPPPFPYAPDTNPYRRLREYVAMEPATPLERPGGARSIRDVRPVVDGGEASLADFRDWLGEPVPWPWSEDDDEAVPLDSPEFHRLELEGAVWHRPGVVHGALVSRNRLALALQHLSGETVRITGIRPDVGRASQPAPMVVVDGPGWRVLLMGLTEEIRDHAAEAGIAIPDWPAVPAEASS